MLDLAWLWGVAHERLNETFGVSAAYGAPAIGGALLCSALYYVQRRRARGHAPSFKGFVRSVFPYRILLHPSSIIDLRMWLLNGLVFASGYAMLAAGMVFWRGEATTAMTAVLGPHAPTAWPWWLVLAMATLFELLAYELAYWFGHYCFHRIPALWEFHKVHHSAEVMTTLTELRQHPVEILAFMNLIAFATGIVFGIMAYAFGPGVRPFTLLNGNIALMLFLVTYGHLRHSHMWIAFTGLAGKLLQSPAHHQIHHSDNPVHFDKNLGFALAFWDWMFGTLYVPSKSPEQVTFGVGEDNALFHSTLGNYVMPVVRFAGRLTPALGAQPAGEVARPIAELPSTPR